MSFAKTLLHKIGHFDEIARNEISEIEKTYMMPEYHVMLGTLEDYAEMAIQFGYTTMVIIFMILYSYFILYDTIFIFYII